MTENIKETERVLKERAKVKPKKKSGVTKQSSDDERMSESKLFKSGSGFPRWLKVFLG